jgi:uroporphyrinogen decarboxylase
VSFKNDAFINALFRRPTKYTPVWIMRQAGRYLPEYRALREEAGSFLNLCKTPELACAATLQPLQRFSLDAAILFSDILTIPDAMGLGLDFIEGEGPRFNKSINSLAEINKLIIPDPDHDLTYVLDAIRLIKAKLANKVPLIGFAGSPFTLAAYIVEGGSSKNFNQIKKMLLDAPEILHQLLKKLSQAVILYLNAQIKAGVDVIMLFDSWGGLLADKDYAEFSLNYLKEILKNVLREYQNKSIPSIVFARGSGARLLQLKLLSADVLGLDENTNLALARNILCPQFILQGNFAPQLLKEDEATIKKEITKALEIMKGNPYIFNLGHGITPDIDPEKLNFLINEVHQQSLNWV